MVFIIRTAFVMIIWFVTIDSYQLNGKAAVHNKYANGYYRTMISKQARSMFSGIVEVSQPACEISTLTLAFNASKRSSPQLPLFECFRKWALSKPSK
jgi:hypothetical protein